MKNESEPLNVPWWLRFGILSIFVIFLLSLSVQPVQSIMAGYGLTWSILISAPVKLTVCWEIPSAAEPLSLEADQTSGAIRREWVRLALKNSWERYARVIFVGWEQCTDEANAADPPYTLGPRRPGTLDENLKIEIAYSGSSHNWGHGSWGDYKKSGVTLNLHCSYPSLKSCIEYLTIHEFGHTLGFYHEEERSDWPTNIPNCPRQTHPPSDPWWPIPTEMRFGAPDPTSVMAYCSDWPTKLSPKDITGVQHLYTRRNPGTLLSVPASLCLSGHANGQNGSGTFGWECDEAYQDQDWVYDRSKFALSIVWPADPQQTRRCLDVDTNTYSKVQIWDCHYGQNQQWSFKNVELRGYGGLCITRPNQGPGPVIMEACSGSPEQLWRIEPGTISETFNIKSNNGVMCLSTTPISGADISVDYCSPPAKVFLPLISKSSGTLSTVSSQTKELPTLIPLPVRDFYLIPGGQIGLSGAAGAGLCADVADVWDSDFLQGIGGPSSSQRVQVFSCYLSQYNQRWNLTGNVVSGEKCLSVTGSKTINGAGTAVMTCNDSDDQKWDYYW